MIVNFSFENSQIAEFASYFQLIVNDNVIVEDTVQSKQYSYDVVVNDNDWNKLVLQVIDCYEIYDPVTYKLVATNSFKILDFSLDGSNSWPIKISESRNIANVKFNPEYFVWKTASPEPIYYSGNDFKGTGSVEFNFFLDDSKVLDHYYQSREKIKNNFLTFENIDKNCYTDQLLNLSRLRVRADIDYTCSKNESTFCKFWGGNIISIQNKKIKEHIPQWVSFIKWPHKWIHADYYGKNLPLSMSYELLGL